MTPRGGSRACFVKTIDAGCDAMLDKLLGIENRFEEINQLQKAEIETQMFSEYEDRYQYFLGIGLLFLLLEFLLPEKKSRWADKIKLFNR